MGMYDMGASRLSLLCCGLLAAGPALAQASSSHACADVAGKSARLACYDEAFPPTPIAHQAEQQQALGRFGQDEEARVRDLASLPKIEASITAVAYASNGQRTLTLDNAQRWLLTDAASRGPLSEGQVVEIRKAALGSYMLVTPSGVSLRARRID